jgi:sugar phosphate isomerase/epimerase
MDEIGTENTEKIKKITAESDRWKFIYEAADSYGFEGIHFTPSLYKEFNLDLKNIPDYFNKFKLTMHFGGRFKLLSENAFEAANSEFNEVYEVALKYNMHDISVHPPTVHGFSFSEKELCLTFFRRFIEKWLGPITRQGITFSLESHVSGGYFMFEGIGEYLRFIDEYQDLGILIDLSHHYYDGCSEEEIITPLVGRKINGLHISDAFHGVNFDEAELRRGTHLAIGGGVMDYPRLMNAFNLGSNMFGVLEIKSNNEGIKHSLDYLKKLQQQERI